MYYLSMNETMKNLEIAKNNGVEFVTREDTVDENGLGLNIIHLNQEQEFVTTPNTLGYAYYRELTFCEDNAYEYVSITDSSLARMVDYCANNDLQIEVCKDCLEKF